MSFNTYFTQVLLNSSSRTSPRADEARRDYIAAMNSALKVYLRVD